MAEAPYYEDPYGEYDPPEPEPEPEPESGYSGSLTIVGWAPSGSSWMPIYRGGDGKYYKSDRTPWGGNPSDLKTGTGDGGRPTWAPGEPEGPDAGQTYEERTKAFNEAAMAPPVAPGSVGSHGGGGSSSGGRLSSSPAINPSYLAPWTEVFRPPDDSGLPTYTAPQPFAYGDFDAPGNFTPPTSEDVLKDPSYLFRRGQMTEGIENSASRRGLLGSSGTIYDIASSVGNLASQEYGNIWNRNFNVWDTNWNNALNAYTTNRNNAVDQYTTNYGIGRDTHDSMYRRSQDIYDRAWQLYDDRRRTFYDNQDRPFDKLYRGVSVGSQASF